jgi:predicted transcriptional regulator
MARPASKHPTELELEILKALWRRAAGTKASTGREVQEALTAGGRELAYTSVVTVLNIMTRKGYLRRRKAPDGAAGFAYQPAVTETSTAGRMLRDLIDRVFHGSGSAVLLKLLEETRLDAGEIARLREAVDRKANEAGQQQHQQQHQQQSSKPSAKERP